MCVPEIIPRPPEFETAAASSFVVIPGIPASCMGTLQPVISVNSVFSISPQKLILYHAENIPLTD
jgi:hypothetical protein